MKIIIVFTAFCGMVFATPGYIAPLPYAYRLGVPVAYDGRILDTPEVAQAKAEHLATQAYEAARNTLGYAYLPGLGQVYSPAITYGAPIGPDGRVVDTPEVAQAKADHLNAHAQEAARQLGLLPYGALAYPSSTVYAYGFGYGAPLAADGRVVDTPEVARAKAAHLAAHAEAATRTGKH